MPNIAYRLARRIAVSVVGFTVLAIGIAMIALPGPAFIVIPAGLGILGLGVRVGAAMVAEGEGEGRGCREDGDWVRTRRRASPAKE